MVVNTISFMEIREMKIMNGVLNNDVDLYHVDCGTVDSLRYIRNGRSMGLLLLYFLDLEITISKENGFLIMIAAAKN